MDTRTMSPSEHRAVAAATKPVNSDSIDWWSETPHGQATAAFFGVAEKERTAVEALVDALVGERVYDTIVEVESVSY